MPSRDVPPAVPAARGGRLPAPHARQLILKSLGCVRLPVEDKQRESLVAYDVALARGCRLAFYEKTTADGRQQVVAREYGGPLPRLTPARPPKSLPSETGGPWSLVGVYSRSRLFTRSWEKAVRGMPRGAVLVVRKWRSPDGVAERTLFKNDRGGMSLQTIHTDGRIEVYEQSSRTDWKRTLTFHPELLTFPVTTAVEIECDDPVTIAEMIRISGEDLSLNTFAGLWDDGETEPDEDLELALTRFPELSLIRLTINGVHHMLGATEKRLVLVPMEVHATGPKVDRELARCSFAFDGGAPGMASAGAHGIGEIRPGLFASWTYDEDVPERCELHLTEGDPIPFMAQEMAQWRLLPLVIDNLLGSRAGAEDLGVDLRYHEEVDAWVRLRPDEPAGRTFLTLLCRQLPGDHPLVRRIQGFLRAGHPDTPVDDALLSVRVRPATGDGTLTVIRADADGQVVLEHRDGFREPEHHHLGTAEPGRELQLALTARPGLLTVPVDATVDISCSDPDLIADLLTFTGDPTANDLDDLFADSPKEPVVLYRLMGMFEQLKAARLTINGTAHLLTETGGRWTPLPVTDDEHRPGFKTRRLIAESSYDFDGGGFGGSGYGSDHVGQIRPGINAAWNTWTEAIGCYLTLDTGHPIDFAAGAISDWPLMAAAVENMIGGDLAEAELGERYDCYDGSASVKLAPSDPDRQRLLQALSARLGEGSEIKKAIDAFLNQQAK